MYISFRLVLVSMICSLCMEEEWLNSFLSYLQGGLSLLQIKYELHEGLSLKGFWSKLRD